MKTTSLLVLLFVGGLLFSRGIHEVAYAQGAAEEAALDAGPSVAAPLAPISTAPVVAAPAGFDWNPMTWDWPWILATVVTVLGGIIMALRPIAAATKWSGDNWILSKLEWTLALIVRLFLPPKMRGGA